MLKNLFVLWIAACAAFIPWKASAQLLPGYQPEQDACQALQICGNFFTPYGYQTEGYINDLPSTPCGNGEQSSVWFRLTVNSPGTIVFALTPVDSQDDYDFAIVDITNGDCSNIQQSQVIRCNFNNNQQPNTYYYGGIIGLNTTSTILYAPGGAYGQNFLQQINANAGDVYLIMVNNYGHDDCYGSCPGSGFLLDFSGSTAQFNQPDPPRLNQILPYCDFSNEITIQLSDNALCSSLAADASDFYLTPSGTIASVEGIGCSGPAGYTNKIKLTFASQLPNGDYTLHAKTGTDGNTLLGLCQAELPLPDSLTFHVGNDPLAYQSIDSPACQTLTVHINSPFACNTIAPDGSDFTISGPSPVSISSANGVGCTSPDGFTQTVQVHLTQPIAVDGLYKLFAQVGTDGNSLNDSCNRILPPGDYISFHVNSFNGILQAYPDTIVCNQGSTVNLYGINNGPAPASGFQYQWTPTTGIANPNSMNTTITLPGMLNQYVLSTIDANGCYLRDSATIKVEPLFGTINPEEAEVCFGDAISLYASGGSQYQWFDNPQLTGTPDELTCTGCPDPYATPPAVGDKSYYVLITNNQGCRDTLRSLLHVNPLPDIVVQPHDTIIKYGDGFNLYATGGINYIWSPAGSLSDPSSASPYATPIKNTDYVVIGSSDKGCLAADTAHIVIDYRTPVLVPNAFSPNGDGLNDVFKVENLTSQKILVFQVYDRWGKLIFETQDREKGWDGTYKNKPMGPGVYQYYIKLAYPDNYMQEFKGDITLIR